MLQWYTPDSLLDLSFLDFAHDHAISVFLNRRAARIGHFSYQSIFHEQIFYSINCIYYISVRYKYLVIRMGYISENEHNLIQCCWPEETTICYKTSLVLWLITNLNVILYLSTCHTIHISLLIIFMIMP